MTSSLKERAILRGELVVVEEEPGVEVAGDDWGSATGFDCESETSQAPSPNQSNQFSVILFTYSESKKRGSDTFFSSLFSYFFLFFGT